jgi:hypothetical protein
MVLPAPVLVLTFKHRGGTGRHQHSIQHIRLGLLHGQASLRRPASCEPAGRARPGAEGEEAPSRGLFALPFMQRALEKRKAAAQAQAEALLQVRRPRLHPVPPLPRIGLGRWLWVLERACLSMQLWAWW